MLGLALPLVARAEQTFEEELIEHCRTFDRLTCADLDEAALTGIVRQGMQRAFGYGFDLRGPVRLFVEMLFIFGNEFDTDPQYPWARELLATPGPSMPRAEQLWALTNKYQDKVSAAAANRAIFRWLRSFRVPDTSGGFTDAMVAELTRLFPEKAAYVGRERMTRVIELASAESDRLGVATDEGRTLLSQLFFAIGHGALRDPLFPTLGASLQDTSVEPGARLKQLRDEVRDVVKRRVRTGLFGLK
jgi:hypothetical protein